MTLVSHKLHMDGKYQVLNVAKFIAESFVIWSTSFLWDINIYMFQGSTESI